MTLLLKILPLELENCFVKELFNDFLVPMIEEAAWWPPRASRVARVPLGFKILISLRGLGMGLVADDVGELSNTAKSTVECIFHEFVDGMVEHFFSSWVKIHKGDRLTKAMIVYQMLGFPGCMGSANATHARCPVSLVSQAKGKEGFPTLAFFTIVDHHKYFNTVRMDILVPLTTRQWLMSRRFHCVETRCSQFYSLSATGW